MSAHKTVRSVSLMALAALTTAGAPSAPLVAQPAYRDGAPNPQACEALGFNTRPDVDRNYGPTRSVKMTGPPLPPPPPPPPPPVMASRAHTASPHFLAFDATIRSWVARKAVRILERIDPA